MRFKRGGRYASLTLLALLTLWAVPGQGQPAPGEPDLHAPFAGPCTEELRYDEEGEAVWTVHYQYDPEGRLTDLQRLDRDGELRSSTTFTWDEDGRLVGATIREHDGDDVVEQSVSWTYDEQGRQVSRTTGEDSAGRWSRNTWTYEGDSTQPAATHSEDSSGDRFERQLRYDESGRLATESTRFTRSDGHYDEGLTTYEYDDQGGLAAIARDNDGDGRVDVRSELTRGEHGAVVAVTTVRGGSSRITYTYDCWQ